MSILNINQFTERVNISDLHFCRKCGGKMFEIPLSVMDAIQSIFIKKKIIQRFKCNDCKREVKTKK